MYILYPQHCKNLVFNIKCLQLIYSCYVAVPLDEVSQKWGLCSAQNVFVTVSVCTLVFSKMFSNHTIDVGKGWILVFDVFGNRQTNTLITA